MKEWLCNHEILGSILFGLITWASIIAAIGLIVFLVLLVKEKSPEKVKTFASKCTNSKTASIMVVILKVLIIALLAFVMIFGLGNDIWEALACAPHSE